ncbi:hypothetical protein GCM10011608_40650 [Micromonospora sonchi]|uniref:Uncharacterized protein n=1 Tax=Micromonospora sonchi TaxID=1763543 RepID=A0A917X1D9_9ACTN|nr:hypothetical protein [Micromonospora sonchi]GGM51607.1 hypothetical protein GCM10011608_40650 [Micromonospora sonchi]
MPATVAVRCQELPDLRGIATRIGVARRACGDHGSGLSPREWATRSGHAETEALLKAASDLVKV